MLWKRALNKRRNKTKPSYRRFGKQVECEHAKKTKQTMTDEGEKSAIGGRNGFGTAKHFKKKILQQHVRPPEVASNRVDVRGGQSSDAPADAQNVGVQRGDLAELVAAKGNCMIPMPCNSDNANGITKKKKPSRLQFRHKNIEVYKLGSTATHVHAKTEILNKIYRQFVRKKLTIEESRRHLEWFSGAEFGASETETMTDSSSDAPKPASNSTSFLRQFRPKTSESQPPGRHLLPTTVCQRRRSIAEPLHTMQPTPVTDTVTSSHTRTNILKRQSTRLKQIALKLREPASSVASQNAGNASNGSSPEAEPIFPTFDRQIQSEEQGPQSSTSEQQNNSQNNHIEVPTSLQALDRSITNQDTTKQQQLMPTVQQQTHINNTRIEAPNGVQAPDASVTNQGTVQQQVLPTTVQQIYLHNQSGVPNSAQVTNRGITSQEIMQSQVSPTLEQQTYLRNSLKSVPNATINRGLINQGTVQQKNTLPTFKQQTSGVPNTVQVINRGIANQEMMQSQVLPTLEQQTYLRNSLTAVPNAVISWGITNQGTVQQKRPLSTIEQQTLAVPNTVQVINRGIANQEIVQSQVLPTLEQQTHLRNSHSGVPNSEQVTSRGIANQEIVQRQVLSTLQQQIHLHNSRVDVQALSTDPTGRDQVMHQQILPPRFEQQNHPRNIAAPTSVQALNRSIPNQDFLQPQVVPTYLQQTQLQNRRTEVPTTSGREQIMQPQVLQTFERQMQMPINQDNRSPPPYLSNYEMMGQTSQFCPTPMYNPPSYSSSLSSNVYQQVPLNHHGRYGNELPQGVHSPIRSGLGPIIMPQNPPAPNVPYMNYRPPQRQPYGFQQQAWLNPNANDFLLPNLGPENYRYAQKTNPRPVNASSERRSKKPKPNKPAVPTTSSANVEHEVATPPRVNENIKHQLKQLITIAQNILQGDETMSQQNINELSNIISTNQTQTPRENATVQHADTTMQNDHSEMPEPQPTPTSPCTKSVRCAKCREGVQNASSAVAVGHPATVIRKCNFRIVNDGASTSTSCNNRPTNGFNNVVSTSETAHKHYTNETQNSLQTQAINNCCITENVTTTHPRVLQETESHHVKQSQSCSKCRTEMDKEPVTANAPPVAHQQSAAEKEVGLDLSVRNTTTTVSEAPRVSSSMPKTDTSKTCIDEKKRSTDTIQYTFPNTETTETTSRSSGPVTSVLEQHRPIATPSPQHPWVITFNARGNEPHSSSHMFDPIKSTPSQSHLPKTPPPASLTASFTVNHGRQGSSNFNFYTYNSHSPSSSFRENPVLPLAVKPEPAESRDLVLVKSESPESNAGNGLPLVEGTLTPQQYVEELQRLREQNVPSEFLEFYEYITRVQIRWTKMPISFDVFLELQNAGSLKILEEQFKKYIENRKSFADDVIIVPDDD